LINTNERLCPYRIVDANKEGSRIEFAYFKILNYRPLQYLSRGMPGGEIVAIRLCFVRISDCSLNVSGNITRFLAVAVPTINIILICCKYH